MMIAVVIQQNDTTEEIEQLADLGPEIEAFNEEQKPTSIDELFSDVTADQATGSDAVPETSEQSVPSKSKKKK